MLNAPGGTKLFNFLFEGRSIAIRFTKYETTSRSFASFYDNLSDRKVQWRRKCNEEVRRGLAGQRLRILRRKNQVKSEKR